MKVPEDNVENIGPWNKLSCKWQWSVQSTLIYKLDVWRSCPSSLHPHNYESFLQLMTLMTLFPYVLVEIWEDSFTNSVLTCVAVISNISTCMLSLILQTTWEFILYSSCETNVSEYTITCMDTSNIFDEKQFGMCCRVKPKLGLFESSC